MEARFCSLITLAVLVFLSTISFAQGEDEQLAHLNRAAIRQAKLADSSLADHLASSLATDGIEGMIDVFYLMRSEPQRYRADEKAMTELGTRLMLAGKTAESIAVLQLTTQTYPDSWQIQEHLGTAYLAENNVAAAELCFDKAAELKGNHDLANETECPLPTRLPN